MDVQPNEVAQPVRLQQAASQVGLHHVVHASWTPWKTAYQRLLGYYFQEAKDIYFKHSSAAESNNKGGN
jgi:hypothetical protein